MTKELPAGNIGPVDKVNKRLNWVTKGIKMSVAGVLKKAGLVIVERDHLVELQKAVDLLYVDGRRQRQVDALAKVTKLVKNL